MTIRCDTTSLVAGGLVCSFPGLGVLAESIPSTGDSGASPLYNDLSLPADNGKEIRMLFTSVPAGTLRCDDYGRLSYDNADGSYQALYQLYVDGIAVGSPATIDFQIGATIPVNVDLSPMELVYEQSADIQAASLLALAAMEFVYDQSASIAAGQVVIMSPMEFVYEQAAATTISATIALSPMVFTLDQIAALIYGNALTLAPMEFVYSQIAGIGAGGAVGLSPMVFEYAQESSVSISATRQMAPMDFTYGQSAAVAAPVSIALDAMEFVYLFNAVVLGGLSESYKATVTFSSARTYGRMI